MSGHTEAVPKAHAVHHRRSNPMLGRDGSDRLTEGASKEHRVMVGTAGRGVTKIKVVAVDDDPLIRELLSIGLRTKSDSLAVDCVGDGFEALELISTQQPDVVITDLDMPRFSGADFAKELERLHPGTPLVIFSGCPPETAIRTVPTAVAAVDKIGSPNCLQSLVHAVNLAAKKNQEPPA